MLEDMPTQSLFNITSAELHELLKEDSSKLVLVDVREQQELDIAAFPFPIVHLPLSESARWLEKLPDRFLGKEVVVVICHSGIRSRNFAIWLIDQGWNYKVCNLEGGIDAWSVNIDPSVPRY